MVTAAVGLPLWNDKGYEILTLPHFLEGTILFKGPHQAISAGTTITLKTIPPSKIYVAVNQNKRDGGLSSTLPSQGWTSVSGSLKFKASAEPEYLDKIWTKTVTTQQVVSFTTSEDELTHAIFVKEGKPFLFFPEGLNVYRRLI